MTTIKVELADAPTGVMLALHEQSYTWAYLRDEVGATSGDMNLLVSLGLIYRQASRPDDPDDVRWSLTLDGHAAIVPRAAAFSEEQGDG